MNNTKINRREFVVSGSLGIAALTIPGFARAASKSPARLAVSVGYLGETGGAFEAAQKILTGDPTLFSRGARLSFGEMKRGGGDPLWVFVDVIYRTIEGADVPFFAFTHTEEGGRVTNSSPSSFMVPVPTQGTIDLSIKARRVSTPEGTALISFAVNTAGQALKLNPGTYVFALADRVDWSSVRLDQPTGFDYVVMTVRADSALK